MGTPFFFNIFDELLVEPADAEGQLYVFLIPKGEAISRKTESGLSTQRVYPSEEETGPGRVFA